MSTYLDFRCSTCKESADLRSSRYGLENELFFSLLQLRGVVGQLCGEAVYALDSRFASLPAFFAAHDGHDVILENGYGQQCLGDPGKWSDASRFRE